MSEQNQNTVNLDEYKDSMKLDSKTMNEVDKELGLHIFHLKQLSQLLLEAYENPEQRNALASVIRDEASDLYDAFYAML